MNAIIKKWGNSLGVRISKPLLDQLNLHENSEVDISVENNTITIKPKRSLDAMLAQIDSHNVHEETDSGDTQGKEIW